MISSCSGVSVVLDLQTRVDKKNPQKLTQLSPRSHPKHLVEKRTAQDAIGWSILDVVCRYLSLFLLYIILKIGKNRW